MPRSAFGAKRAAALTVAAPANHRDFGRGVRVGPVSQRPGEADDPNAVRTQRMVRTPYLSIKNRSAPDLHNPESGTKRPGPVPQRSKTAAKRVVAYEAQTAVLGAHVCAARSDFCESHKEKPRGVPSIATTTFPSSAHPSHPGSLRIRPIENPPGPTRTSAPHLSARPEYLKIRTILVGRGCLAAQRALV